MIYPHRQFPVFLAGCLLLIGSMVNGQESSSMITDFRGLEWGAPLDSVAFDEAPNPVMMATLEAEDGKYYQRKNENLSIGTAELKNIFYVFDDNNRFYKVVIDGKRSANDDMEFILQQKFGPADDQLQKKYETVKLWNVGEADIVFTERNDQDFTLQIQSNLRKKSFYEINTQVDDF